MLGYLITAYRKHRKKAGKKRGTAIVQNKCEGKPERDEAEQQTDGQKIIVALERIYQQNESAAKREQSEKNSHETWEMKRFWLDVSAVIIAIIAAYVLFGQQNIMKGQLDEMLADRRPWIEPQITLNGPLNWTADKDAQIEVLISLKNIGHSPASNIGLANKVIIYNQSSKELFFNPIPEQQGLCDQAKENAKSGHYFYSTILPETTKSIQAGFTAYHSEFTHAWPNSRDASFKIVGCIDYTYSSDNRIHGQTGFSYELQRISNGLAAFGFDPDKGSVPVTEMDLSPGFFGDGYLK